MISGAHIEGPYRYCLWRYWSGEGLGPRTIPSMCSAPVEVMQEELRPAVFVMLNPSTADALQDDPTIRRCVGYAKAWGNNGIVVVNLFAWRAKDPAELERVEDPIGPLNANWLRWAIHGAGVAIAAWGSKVPDRYQNHACSVRATYGKFLKCLKQNADGHPSHPLYLPAELKPGILVP